MQLMHSFEAYLYALVFKHNEGLASKTLNDIAFLTKKKKTKSKSPTINIIVKLVKVFQIFIIE